jgi:hypothetical protein
VGIVSGALYRRLRAAFFAALFVGRVFVARRATAFTCRRARVTTRRVVRAAVRGAGAVLVAASSAASATEDAVDAAASAACDPSLAAVAAACAAVLTAAPTALPTSFAELVRMSSAGRFRSSDILVLRRVTYTYEPEVLDALARHGLAPAATTDPARARAALSDLYRHEIRRLKQSFLRGDIPKADYSQHVIALRRRYWLLSVPVAVWAKAGG